MNFHVWGQNHDLPCWSLKTVESFSLSVTLIRLLDSSSRGVDTLSLIDDERTNDARGTPRKP